MTTIEAVFEDGIFRPTSVVPIANNQRVRLTVEVLDKPKLSLLDWFEQTRDFREKMRAKYGTFPDSTESIAEDRAQMSEIVVDSCVAAKWVLPESESNLAENLAIATAVNGGSFRLLDIGLIEIGNVIWKLVHQKKLQHAEAAELLADFRRIILAIEPAVPLLDRGFEIAMHYDVAVYDAIFVAAVESIGCAGVTSDVPLVKKVGVDFPQIKLLRDWTPSG